MRLLQKMAVATMLSGICCAATAQKKQLAGEQYFKSNFKGDPDYVKQQGFKVNWQHSMDNKSRPGVSFSANVNAGSTKYNQLVPNNPTLNFQNQLSSTISYSKVWKDRPYNISLNANHNQNSNTGLVNVYLPDVVFNVNTLYPFRKKEQTGSAKWYENLGIALNTNAKSYTSFYDRDTLGGIGTQIQNNMQWGASHSIPITLSLPQLGPLQIAPSVSYSERWYQSKYNKHWNGFYKKLETDTLHGFYTAREMSFGLSASTRIFGMFTFNKGKVKAIRHEIRPYLSISYKPDMNGRFYRSVQADTAGRISRYSVFENSVYGAYGEGRFGGMSFGIDNNISMKVQSKKDTSAAGLKKVSLIDGFSLTSSYNFLQDSFRLAPINVSARSNLFEKINITASALLDPYQTDSIGNRIDKLVWRKNAFTLGRLTNAQVSLQASFRGGDKKKDNNQQRQQQLGSSYLNQNGQLLDEYQQELSYMSNNPGEFVDFAIPWDISFGYSFRYNKVLSTGLGFSTQINQDVNWNSSVNLSPKWKVGINGFYNITQKQLGTISMYLSREMHCWQMAIQISPVGMYKFFNITISPKSGMLRDLRINRTRYFIGQ